MTLAKKGLVDGNSYHKKYREIPLKKNRVRSILRTLATKKHGDSIHIKGIKMLVFQGILYLKDSEWVIGFNGDTSTAGYKYVVVNVLGSDEFYIEKSDHINSVVRSSK